MSSEDRSEKESQTEADGSPVRTSKQPSPDLSIVQISTVAYLLMGTVGILISHYGHANFWEVVDIPPSDQRSFYVGVTLLSTGILLIGGFLFEGWFPSYRAIKRAIVHMLGPTSWYTAIYLALVSSIGEELLFRAAILPFAGLLLSSILFGLVHIGPDGGLSTWTLWAFGAGLLLGWLFESTGSIWPPVGCHFLVNTFSLLRIQREYRMMHHPGPDEQELN